MTAAPNAIAVTKALEAVMRNDRGRLTAALIARLRDFQLAEDALQDATLSALLHWGRSGLPASPQGWLLRVALRKAIDRMRSGQRESRKAVQIAVLAEDEASDMTPDLIPDERLRLIFTCCHPALDAKSRVALTLRTLGGLTTPQIAAAFLDQEATMGQRLSRAKAKITAAGIPFSVPEPQDWSDRLGSVLAVLYLIYNAGYSAGPKVGRDLAEEAIFLARLVNQLRPDEAEVEGALALMLLTHARRAARVGPDGATVPPQDQDRALWDMAATNEALALIDAAMARRSPGPYQIKAAIAACQMRSPPDWAQIAALYRGLLMHEPTPVVRLNLAVAMVEAGALAESLALIGTLKGDLDGYQPFHAARASVLARTADKAAAVAAYDRAIAGASSPADAAFLTKARNRLTSG